MTAVDVVVVLAVALSAAAGWRVGGGVVGGFIAGFGGGVIGGGTLAPVLAAPFGPALEFVVVLVVAFGLATALAVAGSHLGMRVRDRLHDEGSARAEQAVGGGLAGVAMLLGLWLVGSVLAAAPTGALGTAIHGSTTLAAVDRVLPPAPAAYVRIGRHLGGARQPSLFAGFEPPPPTTSALPPDEVVADASEAGRAATVKVVADGCSLTSSGSGLVVDGGLVVTNAHVIAGTARPEVHEGDAVHTAEPVLFDPELDVAVLRAPEVSADPLPLADATFDVGTQAAALGFPEPDRTYRAEPAVIIDRIDARGRDLFDESIVEREIYQLVTDARGGGSGGPLVAADGTVIGVMFGRAGNHPGVGYALTAPPVRQRVDEAQQRSEPVATGRCL